MYTNIISLSLYFHYLVPFWIFKLLNMTLDCWLLFDSLGILLFRIIKLCLSQCHFRAFSIIVVVFSHRTLVAYFVASNCQKLCCIVGNYVACM